MEAKHKILVIDDVPMFRDLGVLFLARSGEVVTANDGVQGLEMARREHPAVAVVDLHMPGLDGDAVCRAMKADPDLARIAVILVTDGEHAEDRARCIRAGADDVLAKPIDRQSLIHVVNRFLRSPMRGQPRVTLDAPVCVRAHEGESWGMSRNLSRGGLFVELERAPVRGSEVEVEFRLPGSDVPLSPTAKVVWVRLLPGAHALTGMGLQFLAVDREALRTIEDFLREHSVEGSPDPGGGAVHAVVGAG